MLPMESLPPGRHLVACQKNDRKVAHQVADGLLEGDALTEADGDGEVEGELDTDADGDGDVDGEVEADADGEVDGLLDAEAEEMTVPRLPSRASQR